jgi:hypothetical protein
MDRKELVVGVIVWCTEPRTGARRTGEILKVFPRKKEVKLKIHGHKRPVVNKFDQVALIANLSMRKESAT